MRKLFSEPADNPDLRPTFLSMAALMMLLLPTLLLAMSPQKLTGLPLSVPGPSEKLPPMPSGPIEQLNLELKASDIILTAQIRSTDVRASAGDTETKQWSIKSASDLVPILRRLKSLDPDRTRLRLLPAAESTTADVVYWMDIVRSDESGELFRNVVVDGQ